jgi:hypothetical protein
VNVLDENVPLEQRDLLRAWGVPCRVIGQEVGRLSLGDDNIIALLHRLKQPTCFTRDDDFFNRHLIHTSYSLVWLNVAAEEAGVFVRRFLHHPRFSRRKGRMGTVVRVHHNGLEFWVRNQATLQRLLWPRRR